MGTPVRSPFNNSLTPIRSPRTEVPEHLIVKSRLNQISGNILNELCNYKSDSQQGLVIINLIQNEGSKLRKEESQNSDTSIYNDKMQMLCDQLQTHIRRLNAAQDAIRKCLNELQGLKRLNSIELQSRSWSVKNYINNTKCILEIVDADMLLKRKIMEEVAHSMDKAKSELHRALWEYTDKYLLFRTKILAAETEPL